ncbi:UNVERIFIED_CONTAM: Zinc finger CCCH domain-containing protein 37 [Sesamum indicum]
MANQLYGYTYGGGGGATTSIYSSRSGTASYLSSDTPLLGSSSRYLSADSLSSSSALSSSLLYNPESYSTRIPGISVTTPTHAYGPPGVDVGSTVVSTDSLYAGLKRASSESLYHQTLLGTHNKIGQTEAWYSSNPLAKRPRYESTSHLPIYPQRPGEKDCAYYMQTRTCKFGDSCKFDHPIWVPEGGIPDWKEVPPVPAESLPERPGEPDCPYFLKTQRCKFGIRCKFNHPKDRIAPPGAPEDGDILPERPSEPPCAFYLKTGKCKFGTTCKFHHPKGVQIQSTGVEMGTEVKNTGDAKTGQPPFAPALMHNSKGLPVRPLGLGPTIYPQRPGQLECDYYMKTGICKFGYNCKFHHPVDRSAPTASAAESLLQNVKLTLAGLPRREGAIHCPYYMKTGTCKYGSTCKFDHPPPGEVMAVATSQPGSSSAVGEGKENEDRNCDPTDGGGGGGSSCCSLCLFNFSIKLLFGGCSFSWIRPRGMPAKFGVWSKRDKKRKYYFHHLNTKTERKQRHRMHVNICSFFCHFLFLRIRPLPISIAKNRYLGQKMIGQEVHAHLQHKSSTGFRLSQLPGLQVQAQEVVPLHISSDVLDNHSFFNIITRGNPKRTPFSVSVCNSSLALPEQPPAFEPDQEDGQRKVTNVQTLVRRLGKWPLHIGSQMIKLGPLPGCCGFCHCSYWNSSEHIAPCFLRLCFERLCERYSFFKMEILDNKLLHGSISEESSPLAFSLTTFNATVDPISSCNILYGKKKEADFQYGLVRIRENAESIAFYVCEENNWDFLFQIASDPIGEVRGDLTAPRIRWVDFWHSLGSRKQREQIILKRNRSQLLISSVLWSLPMVNLEQGQWWSTEVVDIFQKSGILHKWVLVPDPDSSSSSCCTHVFLWQIEFGVVNQSVSAFNDILGEFPLIVNFRLSVPFLSLIASDIRSDNDPMEEISREFCNINNRSTLMDLSPLDVRDYSLEICEKDHLLTFSLCTVMLSKPIFVLLDESTNALDEANKLRAAVTFLYIFRPYAAKLSAFWNIWETKIYTDTDQFYSVQASKFGWPSFSTHVASKFCLAKQTVCGSLISVFAIGEPSTNTIRAFYTYPHWNQHEPYLIGILSPCIGKDDINLEFFLS